MGANTASTRSPKSIRPIVVGRFAGTFSGTLRGLNVIPDKERRGHGDESLRVFGPFV